MAAFCFAGRSLLLVRPAGARSNGGTSRIRPVAGRIQPKARVPIARWNLKEARCSRRI